MSGVLRSSKTACRHTTGVHAEALSKQLHCLSQQCVNIVVSSLDSCVRGFFVSVSVSVCLSRCLNQQFLGLGLLLGHPIHTPSQPARTRQSPHGPAVTRLAALPCHGRATCPEGAEGQGPADAAVSPGPCPFEELTDGQGC